MSLSDPELDLLLELLEEDPEDEVFVAVASEYVRRERWVDALKVLAPGLGANPDELEGWALLVRAAAATGQFARALEAAEHLDEKLLAAPEVARAHALAMEQVGLGGPAPAAEEATTSIIASVPLADGWSTPDPMVSADRAEQFALYGRVDRAIRIYRRVLFHNPANRDVRERLRELVEEPFEVEDDLSEEITVEEGAVVAVQGPPPGLDAVVPHLGPNDRAAPDEDFEVELGQAGFIQLEGDEAVGLGLSGDLLQALMAKRGRAAGTTSVPPDVDDDEDPFDSLEAPTELANTTIPLSETPRGVVDEADSGDLTDMVKRAKRRRSLFQR